MGSKTNHHGSTFRRRASRGGFTLLEILLALAVMALVATLFIGATAQLLKTQAVTADDVFWKAVQEARKDALKSEHDIRLKFDPEKKRFLILDSTAQPAPDPLNPVPPEEVPLKEFPLLPEVASDLTVTFLATTKGGPTMLIGGVLVESQPIAYVTFYPDGTCTAFRTQFVRPTGSHVLNIDPWTCAPVLTPPDQNLAGGTP
jgi:prepilin-type N-terminal cleavage/methylation domain-containing protein